MLEKAWADLAAHRTRTVSQHLRELFAADDKRFSAFSARLDDLLLDYSKTAVNAETIELLSVSGLDHPDREGRLGRRAIV